LGEIDTAEQVFQLAASGKPSPVSSARSPPQLSGVRYGSQGPLAHGLRAVHAFERQDQPREQTIDGAPTAAAMATFFEEVSRRPAHRW
jgi:hypothetical protein